MLYLKLKRLIKINANIANVTNNSLKKPSKKPLVSYFFPRDYDFSVFQNDNVLIFDNLLKTVLFTENFLKLPEYGMHSKNALYHKLLQLYCAGQLNQIYFTKMELEILIFKYYYGGIFLTLCTYYKDYYNAINGPFFKLVDHWPVNNMVWPLFIIFTFELLPMFAYELYGGNLLADRNYTWLVSFFYRFFWYGLFSVLLYATVEYFGNLYLWLTTVDDISMDYRYRFNGYGYHGYNSHELDSNDFTRHGYNSMGVYCDYYNSKELQYRKLVRLIRDKKPEVIFRFLPLLDKIKVVFSFLHVLSIICLFFFGIFYIIRVNLVVSTDLLVFFKRFYVIFKYPYYYNLLMFCIFTLNFLVETFLKEGFFYHCFLTFMWYNYFVPLFYFSMVFSTYLFDFIFNFEDDG